MTASAEEIANRPINSVLILIAMEQEAQPLLDALQLLADEPPRIPAPAPCLSFSGRYAELDVHVVCNGKCLVHAVDQVGTVPAALTAYLAIQAFQPDLAISMGTAGGFAAQGAAIGDVFIGASVINHDRRIQIPGFDKYGIGAYDGASVMKLVAALGLKSGVVSSGNSLDFTKEDMDVMVANGAAVKDMEAAAVAWAAHLHACPMFALKAVTDIVDGPRATHEEFLENLVTASHSLKDTLPRVLDFIAGKTLAEL